MLWNCIGADNWHMRYILCGISAQLLDAKYNLHGRAEVEGDLRVRESESASKGESDNEHVK